MFYQFGVNSLNQSLQHYRLAVFDFSIHFFSQKDNQKVALFKVYCKTIENFIAHLKYMEISCGVYNFLVMHWKLDFALVLQTEGRDEGIDCGELASQSGHTVLLHTSCCGKLTEISLCLYQRKSNSELLWLLRIIHRS